MLRSTWNLTKLLLLYRILLGDLHGDACVDDYDGDGISDQEDMCPTDPKISRFDFTAYTTLILDAEGSEQDKPFWNVNKKVSRSISCFKILSKLKLLKRCTLRVSLGKATHRQSGALFFALPSVRSIFKSERAVSNIFTLFAFANST